MKATEQCFSVVLFTMLYGVYKFDSVDVTLQCDLQMKATEQCFPLLLSNLQKNVIQSFESVDEIFKKCQSPFKIP